jgi:N-acetylglucosamine-6-phosphate deacetylase
MAGISLADALRLATSNPGRFVRGRGRLALGEPADLIRFSWSPGDTDLSINTVLVLGQER